MENNPKEKRSSVKAAGLKSAFVLENNEVLLTSFGNGNKAILEKKFDEDNAVSMQFNNKSGIVVDPIEHGYTVKSVRFAPQKNDGKTPTRDDPRHFSEEKAAKTPGDDMIHCRKAIEKQIFGQTFEDNIHIQLAYRIFDINKILAVHVNNIAYALNNATGIGEHDDLFQSLKLNSKDYDTFIENVDKPDCDEKTKLFRRLVMTPRKNYFGDILTCDKAPREINRNGGFYGFIDKDKAEFLYYLLCLLGEVRQSTAHATDRLYSLDDNQKGHNSLINVKCLYNERIKKLNREFLNLSKKDITILFSVFGASTIDDKKAIVGKYYDFVVRKTQKNIGFSIKQLREIMIENYKELLSVKGDKYNSVRPRLYRIFDYVIYDYYITNPTAIEEVVSKLRINSTSEDVKQHIYIEEAQKAWNAVESKILNKVLPQMDSIMRNEFEEDEEINNISLDDMISFPKYAFSYVVYLLTQFIDAKEINDLVTTLINNFDDIASFVDVLKKTGLPCEFTEKYKLFINSKEIVNDLRIINSIARMPSKPEPNARQQLYIDALEILGSNKDDKGLVDYLNLQLSPGNKDHNFRNFIANNVINSSRFNYLVRYANPKRVRNIANNRKLIEFVLNGIPDTQILRYYNSCKQCEFKECQPHFRKELADIITSISEEGFHDVKQKSKGASERDIRDNLAKQASIRLYLTVLYLLVKNLVYVNSRYFMAFTILERDAKLYCSYDEQGNKLSNKKIEAAGLKQFTDQGKIKDDFSAFSQKFISEHPFKKRVDEYVKQNMENSDPQILREFRNCIDHLSAIRKADEYLKDLKEVTSYYQIYHYIVQRYLKDQYVYKTTDEYKANYPDVVFKNPKTLEYFGNVERFGTYSKDFVKALNVPFAYNLPRYKNLSIDALFDKNFGDKKYENTSNENISPEDN